MADFNGLPTDYFKFFKELKSNNNREWFNENKPRFRESVQEPLAAFVARALSGRLGDLTRKTHV